MYFQKKTPGQPTGKHSVPSIPDLSLPPVGIGFHAIADMKTGRVRTWEIRPVKTPAGTPDLHLPPLESELSLLRDFAMDGRLLEAALELAHPLPPDTRLVFSLHPDTLAHPGFPGRLTALLVQKGIAPRQLLLALRDRDLTGPGLLPSGAAALLGEGLGLCLRGDGEKSLSLLNLPRLRPAFLLLEAALLDGTFEKQEEAAMMAATLSDLCRRMGCGLGVSGVDRTQDRLFFSTLGIRFMQGEAIAPESGHPHARILEATATAQVAAATGVLSQTASVGSLAVRGLTASLSDSVQHIAQKLKNRPPTESICLLHENRPAGLLMRYHLDRHLSSPYGNALFLKKSVSRVMDPEPLIRDAGTPMDEVARAAMARPPERLYDDILVTERGVYAGTVSVRTLLDALAQAQMEMARGANPLTGLPGNAAIEERMEAYRRSGACVSLIYADLDHFKVYNDAFGFEAGDRMLLLTSRLIQESAASACGDGVFVGHVGGDDFVVFTRPAEAEVFSETLVRRFGEEVPALYPDTVRHQGFIKAKGRDGVIRDFPLVSISLGIVDCHFHPGMDTAALGPRVAQIKAYAKSRQGNSWVRDRRAAPEPFPPLQEKDGI